MKSMIRVLVVDDHTVVRGGLRMFLMAFPECRNQSGDVQIELRNGYG